MLIKALTGDPEREMALARGRSALETDAYQRRQIEAATAQAQAEADWQAGQNAAAVAAGPVIGRGIYDNINQDIEPAPVEAQPDPSIPMPTARPAYTPQLDAEPVPVEPLLMPTPATAPVPLDRPGSLAIGRGVVPGEAVEPVPVDEEVTGLDTANGATASGDWLPPGTPEPAAQVLPGEVREEPDGSVTVGTTEGPQRFTREEADKLGLLAAYSTDPAGQGGKQAGFMGTVYGDPNDPEQQRRNALLYANKVPGEGGGGETANQLRSQIMGDESYIAASGISANYQNAFNAASQDDRTSDFDLITAVAKLVDPTGVVRGEDVNMIVANQPGMELFKSYLETWKADPKAKLGREIRKDLMRLAHSRASNAMKAYEHRLNEFRGIAARAKIDPADVNLTFEEIVPWEGAKPLVPLPNGKMPTVGEDGNVTDWAGMTPEEMEQWADLNGM